MMDNKQVMLATRLFNKTMAGELEWKPATRDDWYQISFPKYAVRIGSVTRRSEDPTEDDVPDVVIEVINSDGELADTFSDVTLRGSGQPPPRGLKHWYPALNELLNRARRIALGADQAIDAILSELGDDDIPF